MTVPTGTVAEVLDWVGDDPDRAQEALEAERAGAKRSTLIAELESKESSTMTDTATAADEDFQAPGPEAPEEVYVDHEDGASTALPLVLAHPEVEVDRDDDGQWLPADVLQVLSLGGVTAPHGFVLVINGQGYAFTPSLAASLKTLVDGGIAGLVL